MNVIVCGDRNYDDEAYLFATLDGMQEREPRITYLLEGGARGADRLAWRWARERTVPHITIEADWVKLGKRAGIIRNFRLLEALERENFDGSATVVAFHKNIAESKGTKHMLDIAQKAGIRTLLFEGASWDE